MKKLNHLNRALLTPFLVFTLLISPGWSADEAKTPSPSLAKSEVATPQEAGAPEAGEKQNLQEIGKQLNTPVSSIWNITTQSNMTFLKGNLSPSYRGQFTFNFQPVLPIPLIKDWNLIPRPVISFLSNPYIRGVDTVNHTLDWSRTAGMGDMAFVTFLSPNLPRWILGVGPSFIFPTASTYDLGQGKFQMGPAAVAGFLTKDWVGLIFVQNWWSVAGTHQTPVTNQMNFQYALVRMLPGAWQIQMTPNVLVNWRATGGSSLTSPSASALGKPSGSVRACPPSPRPWSSSGWRRTRTISASVSTFASPLSRYFQTW